MTDEQFQQWIDLFLEELQDADGDMKALEPKFKAGFHSMNYQQRNLVHFYLYVFTKRENNLTNDPEVIKLMYGAWTAKGDIMMEDIRRQNTEMMKQFESYKPIARAIMDLGAKIIEQNPGMDKNRVFELAISQFNFDNL